MIIFFIMKINGVNTLLSQEPIPLLDNGYGGESLWSSSLRSWSIEPGPNWARNLSLSETMDTEVSLHDHLYYEVDQWSQHVAQPGAHPSPRQWIRRWVFMIIFFYQKDQWSQHVAQPGVHPSPWQWIRRWVFMIIFFYQEDQWSQHVAKPGANPSPRQWIRRWVFMIIFIKKMINWARSQYLSQTMDTEVSLYDHLYYQEDQWNQHIAQPGANPSPRQGIRRWVFMIIFIMKLINWARTKLSQKPIPLIDNGYRGESLWSSFLWSWSNEPGPNLARSPSLS